MRKIVGFICTICIALGVAFWNIPHEPKIVSSITTMETAYLSIVVDPREVKDVEKLKEKILQMCREDSFENIKLHAEDKAMAKRLYISVYTSMNNLENGIVSLIIKNDEEI